MLDYKQFEEMINEIIELEKLEKDIDTAMKKLSPDFMGFSLIRPMSALVKLLSYSMSDTNEWISYWLYELDFGRKAVKNTVTDKKGKNIPLKTISNLYDILTDTGKSDQ